MNEIQPHKPENTDYFRVMVYRGTCYGSPATEIKLNFDADEEKVSCEFSEGLNKKNVSIQRAEAEKFLAKISDILEKEEVLTDVRSVVSYHAEINWENLAFINGEKSGKFKSFSNEWFIDQIEEFIKYETESPEIRERFQKILDSKPHRHALEIYRAVKDFRRKCLM